MERAIHAEELQPEIQQLTEQVKELQAAAIASDKALKDLDTRRVQEVKRADENFGKLRKEVVEEREKANETIQSLERQIGHDIGLKQFLQDEVGRLLKLNELVNQENQMLRTELEACNAKLQHWPVPGADAKEVERLGGEVRALSSWTEYAEMNFRDLVRKIVMVMVENTAARLTLMDMKLLGSKFQFAQHARNSSPPSEFLLPSSQSSLPNQGNQASFATLLDTQVDVLNSDFGGLLCVCLNDPPVSENKRRRHLRWLDEVVLPKVCQEGVTSEKDQIILCCLLWHIRHLLMNTFSDEVSFAWTTCLMTRLACVWTLSPAFVMSSVQQTTTDCSLLCAASILRARMLRRTMSDNFDVDSAAREASTAFPTSGGADGDEAEPDEDEAALATRNLPEISDRRFIQALSVSPSFAH